MFGKILKLVKVLISKPFDTSTEKGREQERVRRIAQSGAMGMISKFMNIISGIITVPITLPYLGVEQFGIWMALTGFVAFLAFTDLGISIGLQTALSKCNGQNNREKPAYYISSSLVLILIISTILCLFSYYLLPIIDLTNIIKIEEKNSKLLLATTQVLIITFAVGLPAGLIQRIFEAYQHGFYSNTLLLIGRVLSLLSVFVCIELHLALPYMFLAYMGLPFVVLIIGGFFLFWTQKWLRPNVCKIRCNLIKEIFGVGGLALLAQIGASIMTVGPLLILTSKYGAAAIVPFTITQRLLGVVSIILGAFLGPLWPAYTEAKERGDFNWVKKIFFKSIYLSCFCVVPFFVFFTVFGQWVIEIWAGNEQVVPDLYLLMICNIWMVLFAGIRVFSMFLNGLGQFKGQAIYGILIPIFAVFIGSSLPIDVGIAICLMLTVLIGELGRLIAMGIESHIQLKRLEKI